MVQGHLLSSQENKIRKANLSYEKYAFADAITSYEELTEKGYSDIDIYKNLGNSNFSNANYEEACKWYEKLMEASSTALDKDYKYRYAQSLKSLKKYDRSDEVMEEIRAMDQDDGRGAKYVSGKNYLSVIAENSGRYDISRAPFNSETSDFAAMFYNESVIFASARDTGLVVKNKHRWNNQPFLNLYRAGGENNNGVLKFSKKLNTLAHESSTAFTKDGKTIYFPRNNFKKGFARDSVGISRLKIYRAEWTGSAWSEITELPFNNDNYSVAHPAPEQRKR